MDIGRVDAMMDWRIITSYLMRSEVSARSKQDLHFLLHRARLLQPKILTALHRRDCMKPTVRIEAYRI